ncbi:hypothetical protein FNV43_RR12919 [Rhamnella rubrinervis]|uniref:Uncharacterized protein n=1 Tax=Rhamnella rubrinervis TaxID=2594499 RepID=A0A8K0H031_9ROSA|nr:hypothetical protein FNV43_RR12919 [Rhamnella rubrinervis]
MAIGKRVGLDDDAQGWTLRLRPTPRRTHPLRPLTDFECRRGYLREFLLTISGRGLLRFSTAAREVSSEAPRLAEQGVFGKYDVRLLVLVPRVSGSRSLFGGDPEAFHEIRGRTSAMSADPVIVTEKF